jgi:hypothetical protein
LVGFRRIPQQDGIMGAVREINLAIQSGCCVPVYSLWGAIRDHIGDVDKYLPLRRSGFFGAERDIMQFEGSLLKQALIEVSRAR